MLHNGRSGSTLLGDMLDQHKDIYWDGETFEKQLHRLHASTNIDFPNLYGRISTEDALTEVQGRLLGRAGNRIFGTEIQDYQVKMMGASLPDYIGALRELGFNRFLFLQRNYLRKIASHMVATARNQHHVGTQTTVKTHRIKIEPGKMYLGHRFTTLLDALAQYKEFADQIRANCAPEELLEIRYEHDLQDDPRIAARKVTDFLGLPPHTPKVKFGKTTTANLADVVENYDEVVEILSNSPFADQLETA